MRAKGTRSRSWFVLMLCALIAAGTLPLGAGQASAATSFANIAMNTSTPAMYSKFEMTFNLSSTYTNPYNPDEVNVYATFTTPSGKTEIVPGFYKSNTSPKWAVRYSPREAGAHSVVLRVSDASGTGQSGSYAFTAGGPGANRGFMSTQGTRFVDSFGSQITLIGTNFAWNNPNPNAVTQEIPNLKPAKMNLLRVWYSCWWSSLAPEWGPITANEAGLTTVYEGIGRYQLDNQARMDQMFEAAEANDVYIMLTMLSFGDFYYQWNVNAYNQANGGPSYYSENNTDFWTNPAAKAYQKKLLRYMFARYGYSRALGMLEYWNESDNRVDTTAANRASWHAEMDNYWKSLDFYNHVTTTSYAWKDHAGSGQQTWETLTTLDATNVHRYDSSADVITAWEQQIDNLLTLAPNKPAFIGEVGRTHDDQTTDPTIDEYMHNALWAPIFRAGAAGGSLWWIFETGFALPANYKAIHTRLANFVQPAEKHLIHMPHVDYGQQTNGTKVGGFKSDSRAYLWINDTQANHTVTSPRTVSGMSLTIPMANNYYKVSYYDTYAGTFSPVTTVQATGGNLVLTGIPSFSRDIAVKIECEGCDAPDTQAPTAPTGLTSPSKTDTTVSLSWSPSTDNVRVTDYDVYRGATLVGSTGGATTYTAGSLTAGTSYSFTVRAKDAAGNVSAASGALSVTTNPPDTTAPTAPSGLTSPSKLDKSVQLSWTASTDNVGVTAYDIYRNGSLAGSVSGTVTTYTDSGLTPQTAYSYYVRARDARNNVSANSNTISVTTLALIPENRLQNPGFDQSNSSSKPASWTCENDYFCYRDTAVKRSGTASMRMSGDSGPWLGFYQDVTAAAGQTYTFDGYFNASANNGTTIEFRLRFLDGAGGVIQDNLLQTHTGTNAGFVNVTGARVAPAGTATARVYIYMRDLRGALYFDDFSLVGGTGGGTDTQAPTAPSGLTSPSKTATSVNLSWTASTDNVGVTGYEIYRGAALAGTTTGATTYTATGLSASTAYSFTVRAKDAAGNTSAASGALSVTTDAASDAQAPSAPTALASPSKTDTSVSLSWTASTDNVGVTGYEIYRGATLAGTTTGATTYTATGLAPSTAYSFTVRAKDAAGNVSAASSALSVTTNAASGGGGNGLTAQYYDMSDLTNLFVTRIDPNIDFNWDHGSPAAGMGENTWSARWTGKVQPQYSETYTFTSNTDDGVRVWVNNQLIIDKWVGQGATEWNGTIALAAGVKYDIKVEYFDDGGGALAQLYWSSASQPKQIVPQSRLFTN
ncbi:fibronectin type III domain-containing protein [Paenibacillus xanthanilyticus]|uniref:Fibronectin type III domain-containing protein n=1 Tax=Paenibacillus xanthanilyticus TaxID=1783531 RepID=A0ABV8K162_9BACL